METPYIALENSDTTVRLISRDEIKRIRELALDCGGEEAVALATEAWNMGGNVDLKTMAESIIDFYSHFKKLKRSVLTITTL